ncbi:MAG: hypothetical protein IPJ65_02340 [Archangiaceae bacterium]|nr:hypothetical protein [Archangiaceae bacterium]
MGNIVSGITKAVGDIGKQIGGPIGGLLKGVSDFAGSPLGQMAITAGLAFFTGGSSLLAGGGLTSMLGGGGMGAGLSSLFGGGGASSLLGGFASSFLSDPSSLLSGSGLTSALNLSDGMGSGGLADLLKAITGSQNGQGVGDGAQQGQLLNLQQLMAYRQAQSLA